MGSTEAIVPKGTERWLVINVAAADSFLQIERHGLSATRVGHRDSETRRKNAIEASMAVLFFRIERVSKIARKAPEGIMPAGSILKKSVPKAIVDYQAIAGEIEMRPKERLVV